MNTRAEFLKKMAVGMVAGPAVVEALVPVVTASPVAVRTYVRMTVDNHSVHAAGAFDDLSDRIFDKLWDSWASMEIRHSIL